MFHIKNTLLLPALLVIGFSDGLAAADWPMWGCTAGRGFACEQSLPEQLTLRWTRQLPAQRPAWPASQQKLQHDRTYHPIVTGDRILVASTANDAVTAYDTGTGKEVWRFYTDGPIRFAPVADAGRVFAGSDDGYLYCLRAEDGELLWKFRGGPTDRRIVGNHRLVSSWPIRGGPVVADGTVYFAASIWPFMGVFVHAVDAETGVSVWTNSETGSRWMTHPHGAPSFGSIVPQGYLAIANDYLIVPGGRSLPAVFDRKTGELKHFQFGGKGAGGWRVTAHEKFYAVGRNVLATRDGSELGAFPVSILTPKLLISDTRAIVIDDDSLTEVKRKDRRGADVTTTQFKSRVSWPVAAGNPTLMAMAGDRVFGVDGSRIVSFDVAVARKQRKGQRANWSTEIDGQATGMLVADEKLFVVTEDAKLLCFAGSAEEPVVHSLETDSLEVESSPLAEQVIEHGGSQGYAIAVGIGDGKLISRVVSASRLHVIAIDPNQTKVESFRRKLDGARWYGERVTAHVGDVASFHLPPYLANVIFVPDVSTDVDDAVLRAVALYPALRPYGGALVLALTDAQHDAFAKAIADANLSQAEVSRDGAVTVLARVGPLPGTGDWSHQYADAANTLVSADRRVRVPLGLLWFGGPPNDEILPRHGHGPSPQVAGGRLVIEGPDMLRCMDVYTGRVLWEKDLPGLGQYYDTTRHFAGAGEIGSNYVTMPDALYVAYGEQLLMLDAATGETKRTLRLESESADARPAWGYLAVSGDTLVCTSSPVTVRGVNQATEEEPVIPSGAKRDDPVGSDADDGSTLPKATKQPRLAEALSPTKYSSASRTLLAIDRHTGEVRWRRTAGYNFRHNAIAVADGKVFCVDSMTDDKLQMLKRRGIEPSEPSRLFALDLQTGKEIWSTERDVFGTFLSYSPAYDVLLQAGSAYRDRARDEVKRGMVAYRGGDGRVLWKDLERDHGGPCLLWRDKIITNGGGGTMYTLLTGDPVAWQYKRMYGCNTAVGSQNLLTFRSGAAGFFDLEGDSGTGNIGGFRSSCTANLIVADGVLSAPDYTRTCSCAYQNQCSLALVHMSTAEAWTFSSLRSVPERIGINLGAPGDRRDPGGTLWFDVPSVGGSSPDLPVSIEGNDIRVLRHHASRVVGGSDGYLPWVAASCVSGVEAIEQKLPLESPESKRYTVRLHFAELEDMAEGERVFDVSINGKRVLQDFDIRQQAGESRRAVVRVFADIPAERQISITFAARQGRACISGVAIIPQR